MTLSLQKTDGHVVYTKTALEGVGPVLDISVPAGVSAITPVDQATGVSMETEFRWTGPPNSVFAFIVPGTGHFTEVVTTATSVRLSEFASLGITLTPGNIFRWSIVAYGPFNSVDDAVTSRGFHPVTDHIRSDVLSRQFTP
jgi:hypothetical protein